MATNATNSSICSTTSLNYVLNTLMPDPATNLVFDSFTNIATESPLMSWTASPTANVEYRVSLGTSVRQMISLVTKVQLMQLHIQ